MMKELIDKILDIAVISGLKIESIYLPSPLYLRFSDEVTRSLILEGEGSRDVVFKLTRYKDVTIFQATELDQVAGRMTVIWEKIDKEESQ